MLSNTCHMLSNDFHMLFKDYDTMICGVRNLICCVKLENIWIALYFSDDVRTEVNTPQIDGNIYELLVLFWLAFYGCWLFRLFVCLFFVIKPAKIHFASRFGLGRVALPAVLPKVQHRPEPLYGPSEVNSRQVDGLGWLASLDLRKPYTKSHPQPPNSVPWPLNGQLMNEDNEFRLVPWFLVSSRIIVNPSARPIQSFMLTFWSLCGTDIMIWFCSSFSTNIYIFVRRIRFSSIWSSAQEMGYPFRSTVFVPMEF